MGAIQQPTANMANWSNEMRSESWYLTRTGTINDACNTDPQAGTWTFPADEQPAVLAALQQASKYIERFNVNASAQRGWSLTRDNDLLTLTGPFVMLGSENRRAYDPGMDVEYSSAEIEYADLDQLIALFA